MSSTPGPTMELLGRIAYELHQMKPLVPTYIHLLVSAIFPIYTAAHASLARPSSAAPTEKKGDINITDLEDEEISPTIETLRPSDAILFPVLAGTVLASLYFILKWLQDPALLNYYLGLYFAIVGLFFTIKFTKDGLTLLRSAALPNQYSYRGNVWKLVPDKNYFAAVDKTKGDGESIRKSPLPGNLSILLKNNTIIWSLRKFVYTKLHLKLSIWKLINVVTIVDTLDFVSLAVSAPLVAYHTFIAKPWFLTNFLGFSFCYGSLQITTPGTSWTGSLLLMALFFYDIYFVFFTPMMVTVATKLDVPIKLLFPRPDACVLPMGAGEGSKAMEEYLECLAKKRTMAMLGLGDIVIPGMMLAFALRFDLYQYYRKLAIATNKTVDSKDKSALTTKVSYLPATGSWGERFWTSTALRSPEMRAKQFPKTYFNASVVGYVLGMITTVVVMQVSQHAQPALLYLVPGVLLSLWGTALVKGDFKILWSYSEVPEVEDGDKKKEESNSKDDEDQGKNDGTKKQESEVEKKVAEKPDSKAAITGDTPSVIGKKNDDDADESHNEKESKDDSDSQHIIYLSLSFINEHKASSSKDENKEQNDDTPQIKSLDTTTSYSTSSDEVNDRKTPPTESQTSSDEFDVSSADEQLISKQVNTPTPTRTGAKQVSHIPDHDGDNEPAVKRRRKA